MLHAVARAYPIRIMNYHEIINDFIGPTSIAVTYCPLCDSAAVFDRNTALGIREFGVSGLLYNSNVLIYDRGGKPESLWSQVRASGVSGPARNDQLRALPLDLTTWKSWRKRHPQSQVLSLQTGHSRDYSQSPYAGCFATPQLMFPVSHSDQRLPAKAPVIGVWTRNSDRSIAVPAGNNGTSDVVWETALDQQKFTVMYDAEFRTTRITSSSDQLRWSIPSGLGGPPIKGRPSGCPCLYRIQSVALFILERWSSRTKPQLSQTRSMRWSSAGGQRPLIAKKRLRPAGPDEAGIGHKVGLWLMNLSGLVIQEPISTPLFA